MDEPHRNRPAELLQVLERSAVRLPRPTELPRVEPITVCFPPYLPGTGTIEPADLARMAEPLQARTPRIFSCPFCHVHLPLRGQWGPHLDGSCVRSAST